MDGIGELKADRINYYWRLFGTGLGFTLFGLGGVLMAIFLLPAVWMLARSKEARIRLGRKGVQGSFRLFLWVLTRLGAAEIRFNGFEALRERKGMLVVASHPTLIDVICLVARIDNADCVVKHALTRNPATAGPITAAAYLTNIGGEGLIHNCVTSVRRGSNLVIFPEGTRSVPGKPMKLQRGAANIALEGGIPLTPVRIVCNPPTLTKNTKWYNIPHKKFVITLTVLEDIHPDKVVQAGDSRALGARKLNTRIKQLLS